MTYRTASTSEWETLDELVKAFMPGEIPDPMGDREQRWVNDPRLETLEALSSLRTRYERQAQELEEVRTKGTELHVWLSDIAEAVSDTRLRTVNDLAPDVRKLRAKVERQEAVIEAARRVVASHRQKDRPLATRLLIGNLASALAALGDSMTPRRRPRDAPDSELRFLTGGEKGTG